MLPSSEPDASDSDTIAVELKDVQRLGIYDVRSERKRNVILLVAAIVSVLLPFSGEGPCHVDLHTPSAGGVRRCRLSRLRKTFCMQENSM